ncbi:MAG: hypothetical protein ACRC8D_05920 [Aeromonas sp.]
MKKIFEMPDWVNPINGKVYKPSATLGKVLNVEEGKPSKKLPRRMSKPVAVAVWGSLATMFYFGLLKGDGLTDAERADRNVVIARGLADAKAEKALLSARKDYLRNCEAWGRNDRAVELVGGKKHKDWSAANYYAAQRLKGEHPALTEGECRAAYLKGSKVSHQRFVNGSLKRED